MRENAKRTLLNMTFFGMIIVMLAIVVTLIAGLFGNEFAGWVRVGFTILSILLVIDVIYQVITIFTHMDSYPAGLFLFILSVATVIMTFILYSRFSVRGGMIMLANLDFFLFAGANLIVINLLSIAIYIVGLYLKQPNEVKATRITTSTK